MRVLGLNEELIFLLLMKVAHEFELPNVLSKLAVPQLQFSNVQFFVTAEQSP
jgi:hypothetical protein